MRSPGGVLYSATELCAVIQLNAHGLNDTIFQNGWRAGKEKDLHFSVSSRILVPLGNNMEDKKKLRFSGLEIFWSIKAYVHQSMP